MGTQPLASRGPPSPGLTPANQPIVWFGCRAQWGEGEASGHKEAEGKQLPCGGAGAHSR